MKLLQKKKRATTPANQVTPPKPGIYTATELTSMVDIVVGEKGLVFAVDSSRPLELKGLPSLPLIASITDLDFVRDLDLKLQEDMAASVLERLRQYSEVTLARFLQETHPRTINWRLEAPLPGGFENMLVVNPTRSLGFRIDSEEQFVALSEAEFAVRFSQTSVLDLGPGTIDDESNELTDFLLSMAVNNTPISELWDHEYGYSHRAIFDTLEQLLASKALVIQAAGEDESDSWGYSKEESFETAGLHSSVWDELLESPHEKLADNATSMVQLDEELERTELRLSMTVESYEARALPAAQAKQELYSSDDDRELKLEPNQELDGLMMRIGESERARLMLNSRRRKLIAETVGILMDSEEEELAIRVDQLLDGIPSEESEYETAALVELAKVVASPLEGELTDEMVDAPLLDVEEELPDMEAPMTARATPTEQTINRGEIELHTATDPLSTDVDVPFSGVRPLIYEELVEELGFDPLADRIHDNSKEGEVSP